MYEIVKYVETSDLTTLTLTGFQDCNLHWSKVEIEDAMEDAKKY